ncbi:MAG: tyrosine--tRNA ligase [Deltaproteobacteria bacterium]|nr:tyrosine--tRNA ligase [Deltaproteobacteria bacterium]
MSAEQLAAFRRNAIDLISDEDLARKLERGRPLRIKYGCDPSAPDLHLGHVVGFEKLRALQEFGHTIIFLVGDFTAMIGDPTGRSKTRPALSREQVDENARTYVDQVGLVLDTSRVEVRFNSEWMDAMTSSQLVKLASKHTVARMLERDDFHKRYSSGAPIAVHELLYPLVQAYDSVALEADVEVGGTDQIFNLLLGREIQRAYGQEPQVVLTWPLIEGTDGVEKMSKSLGNAIGVAEAGEEIYGKLMSISDGQLARWIGLLSRHEPELTEAAEGLAGGTANPRDAKAVLARTMVERLRGPAAAAAAEDHFDRVIRRKQAPDEVPEVPIAAPDGAVGLLEALESTGFARSRSEGRRLVAQGGVRIDEGRVSDPSMRLEPGSYLLQVGKRRFARLVVRA